MAGGLKSGVGEATRRGLNGPVVGLGVERLLRRGRRRRRVRMSMPRYRFLMSVLCVVRGDSVISGDEGSGVPGMNW